MFGNKKETTNTSSSNSSKVKPSASGHSLNSLVIGTSIDGTITSESDIRVDGKIKGKLECKSKVIIGPSGERLMEKLNARMR